MSSLTSSYAGALILASMAALGAAYLGNTVPGESKPAEISPLVTPPTPSVPDVPEVPDVPAVPEVPAPNPLGLGAPAPTPSAPQAPEAPSATTPERPTLSEEEARRKLKCVVSDAAIDAMFKFVKTPVKDWAQIGPTTTRLSALIAKTMTHQDRCPAVMARICVLVFNKYSQMVKAIRDPDPSGYDNVGSVWFEFSELVDELPDCGETGASGTSGPSVPTSSVLESSAPAPVAPLALPAPAPAPEAPLALPAPAPTPEAPLALPAPAPAPEAPLALPAPAPAPEAPLALPAPAPEPEPVAPLALPAPAPVPEAPSPEPTMPLALPAPSPEPTMPLALPAPAPEPVVPIVGTPAPEPVVSVPEPPSAIAVPEPATTPPTLPGEVPEADTSNPALDQLFPFRRLQKPLPPAVDQSLLQEAEQGAIQTPINTDIYRDPGEDISVSAKALPPPSEKQTPGQGFNPLKFAEQATAYLESLKSSGTPDSEIRKVQDTLVKQYEKELRAAASRGLLSGTMANAFIGETRKKICGGRRTTARQDHT